jgi:hypothetical protein
VPSSPEPEADSLDEPPPAEEEDDADGIVFVAAVREASFLSTLVRAAGASFRRGMALFFG